MSKRKILPVLLTFAVLSFLLAIVAGCDNADITTTPKAIAEKTETAPMPTPPVNREPLTIAAGGDIMLGSTFPNETRMPPNDGADSLRAVAPIFQAADIAFANLEGPLIDGGVSEKCGDPKPGQPVRCFAFRMPTRYGKYLKEAGFDVLSLANNHAGDFGEQGRASTRRTLDALGIKHAGSDKAQFASNAISLNVNDLETARRVVADLSKKTDIVVVSFHGGAEGSSATRVPQQTEIFFGEKRGNLPLFAKTVIDAGADLVLGHGPHVLRGMEIYKDRLVAYSLGNFATYGWFQLVGATAETLVLEVEIDADGKFLSGKIHPFVLQGRGILTADPTKSAVKTLRNLSQMDFPASAPKISDDGLISAK
jgi:hypothetical protein